MDKTTCPKCQKTFETKIYTTLIGFRAYNCPKCNAHILLPMKEFYLLSYVIIVIAMAFYSIVILSNGEIPIPGLIGIAVIYALWKNHQLKKNGK